MNADASTAGSDKACCSCGGGADNCCSDPYWEIDFSIAGKVRCEDFANYGDINYGTPVTFCNMADKDNITGHEACCECNLYGISTGGTEYVSFLSFRSNFAELLDRK